MVESWSQCRIAAANFGSQPVCEKVTRCCPRIHNSCWTNVKFHPVLIGERFAHGGFLRHTGKQALKGFQPSVGLSLEQADADTFVLPSTRRTCLQHVTGHAVFQPDVVVGVAYSCGTD